MAPVLYAVALDDRARLRWMCPLSDEKGATMPGDTLERLAATIRQRRADAASNSYTRQLLDGGAARCAKKLGEEAVEIVIAAVHQDDVALRAEAADLLYHLLVLLEARGIALEEVLAVLEGRMGRSGLDEKAARQTGA